MMNERIRELAKQAGAGWDDKYHWFVGKPAMEKFAELLIEECISLAKEAGADFYTVEYVRANLGITGLTCEK